MKKWLINYKRGFDGIWINLYLFIDMVLLFSPSRTRTSTDWTKTRCAAITPRENMLLVKYGITIIN